MGMRIETGATAVHTLPVHTERPPRGVRFTLSSPLPINTQKSQGTPGTTGDIVAC